MTPKKKTENLDNAPVEIIVTRAAPPIPTGPMVDPTLRKKLEARKAAMLEKAAPKPKAPEISDSNLPAPEGELGALKSTDICEFNRLAEGDFVRIALTLLAKNGAMRMRELQIETAARLDVSIETTKRYILKHSSSISELKVEGGWVTPRNG